MRLPCPVDLATCPDLPRILHTHTPAPGSTPSGHSRSYPTAVSFLDFPLLFLPRSTAILLITALTTASVSSRPITCPNRLAVYSHWSRYLSTVDCTPSTLPLTNNYRSSFRFLIVPFIHKSVFSCPHVPADRPKTNPNRIRHQLSRSHHALVMNSCSFFLLTKTIIFFIRQVFD